MSISPSLTYNHSVEYLKLAAFTDELNNVLMVLEEKMKNETSDKFYQRQEIIEYFQNRIKQLKNNINS